MENFTLKGNRVVVEPETPQTKTASGLLYIPETLQQERNIGKVIAIGDTVDNKDLLGKEVMYTIQTAQKFELGEIKGKLIFVVDIIAILN